MDLINERHHVYEFGVVDNFVLTKLIFGISTIYIHSVHKLLDNADLNRRLLRVDSTLNKYLQY
jgi:hypothetical protein